MASQFERRAEAEFRRRGWSYVRSAGSLGAADYVVLTDEGSLLVQVVGPNDRPTLKEAEQLIRMQGPPRTSRWAQFWHYRYAPGQSRYTKVKSGLNKGKLRRRRGYELHIVDLQGVSIAQAHDIFRPAPPSAKQR